MTLHFPDERVKAPMGDPTNCVNGGWVYGPNLRPLAMSFLITNSTSFLCE